MRLVDLTGKRFGRLQVIALHPERRRYRKNAGYVLWLCLCDCGVKHVVPGNALRQGRTKSCGCIRRTHGLYGTRIYRCFHNMKQRCFNPRHRSFPDYGGRGIIVREDLLSVQKLFARMGHPPPGKSINRVDNDGDYTANNLEWASHSQQNLNRRPRKRKRRRAGLADILAYADALARAAGRTRSAP
jgi:hypothetical protein